MIKAISLALALTLAPTPLGVAATNDAALPVPVTKVKKVEIDPRTFTKQRASRSGWSYREWKCLDKIVWRESRWRLHAKNKHSSAYGLFQILKMKPGTPLQKQVEAGISYINSRYGSACVALNFHNKHGWY